MEGTIKLNIGNKADCSIALRESTKMGKGESAKKNFERLLNQLIEAKGEVAGKQCILLEGADAESNDEAVLRMDFQDDSKPIGVGVSSTFLEASDCLVPPGDFGSEYASSEIDSEDEKSEIDSNCPEAEIKDFSRQLKEELPAVLHQEGEMSFIAHNGDFFGKDETFIKTVDDISKMEAGMEFEKTISVKPFASGKSSGISTEGSSQRVDSAFAPGGI
ncbi:MAG: hypothetical protein C0604_03780, partial [Clostridiales bacterium]